MKKSAFSYLVACWIALFTFNTMADDVSVCPTSEHLNIEYYECRDKSHEPVYKAEISDLCKSLPICSNNSLTEEGNCRINTSAYVADKTCDPREFHSCEHITGYEKSEVRVCPGNTYDGIGSNDTCEQNMNDPRNRCGRDALVKLNGKDHHIEFVSYVRHTKDSRFPITGHRIKASHRCEFKYHVHRPIKANGPHSSCGVKEYYKCWRPGYSQCRLKEFGIEKHALQKSKACGVKKITALDQGKSSLNKTCLKCDHLPKDSSERFKCLDEIVKLSIGLPKESIEVVRAERQQVLLTKLKQGEVFFGGWEETIEALRVITDKEYDRIVWSFFAGQHPGQDGELSARFFLSETVRAYHSTDWIFLNKMQTALKEADFKSSQIFHLLNDYFIRASVSSYEKLRADRLKVIELRDSIIGKDVMDARVFLSKAKAVGISEERIIQLKNNLAQKNEASKNKILTSVLSELSASLKRELNQSYKYIKATVSQYEQVTYGDNTFLNVYLDVANLNMRSALTGVKRLVSILTEMNEWGTGFAIQENMKLTIERKMTEIRLLLTKLAQEKSICSDSLLELDDLDPGLSAVLMQVKKSTNHGRQSVGCEAEIQTVRDLMTQNYMSPLLELKREFEKEKE